MGRLIVDVTECRSDEGMVVVELFTTPESGGDPEGLASRAVPVRQGGAQATFSDLGPGSYAVCAFHDENGNGEIDVLRGGLPSEGVGFSHNPEPGGGVPRFDEARFAHGKGDARIRVRMRYAVAARTA